MFDTQWDVTCEDLYESNCVSIWGSSLL